MRHRSRRRSRSRRTTPARRQLAGLLLVQLLGLGLIAGYALGEGGALDPDHGLRQLDLLSLHAVVPGLPTVPGRPTMVVAAGLGAGCLAKIATAGQLRGRPGGLPDRYGLVVLVPTGLPGAGAGLPGGSAAGESAASGSAAGAGVVVRPDPQGRLAASLALPRALRGCHPGYALIDSAGVVRYRTYDPNWEHDGGEESILLAALS